MLFLFERDNAVADAQLRRVDPGVQFGHRVQEDDL